MNKRFYLTLATIVLLGINGCIASGLFGGAAVSTAVMGAASQGKPMLDVNMSGEAKNQAVRLSNRTQNTDKRKIKTGNNAKITDNKTVYNKQMSTPVLILLVLGWFLPSPRECGKLFITAITAIRKAFAGGII